MMKRGMKIFIHVQTSTREPIAGCAISHCNGYLLISYGIKANPYLLKLLVLELTVTDGNIGFSW